MRCFKWQACGNLLGQEAHTDPISVPLLSDVEPQQVSALSLASSVFPRHWVILIGARNDIIICILQHTRTLLCARTTALLPSTPYSFLFILPASPSVKTPWKSCQRLCLHFSVHFSPRTVSRHSPPSPHCPARGALNIYLKGSPVTSTVLNPNVQVSVLVLLDLHPALDTIDSSFFCETPFIHLPEPHDLIFFSSHYFSFSISLFGIFFILGGS